MRKEITLKRPGYWLGKKRPEMAAKKSLAMKGKQLAWITSDRREEICKKISKAKLGVKNPKASAKLKGRVFTEEHKEKLRQSKLKNPRRYWLGKKRPGVGKKVREKLKGRKWPDEQLANLREVMKKRRGIPKSKEARKRMSEAQKKRVKEGRHPLYKGGVSKEHKRIRASLKFKLWREAVFDRDNFTCQKCKIRGGTLHPHHLKSFASYPLLRFEISNGQTLCVKCHKETENWGRPPNAISDAL